MEVPTRIVHLPLSWDDPATRLAIEKYTQSVRKDAPWCPSNIEFIRRINGLDSHRGRAADRVRRVLPRARPRRRVSRRAGGDAGRSAASPGHDQVQPGAHLDARECGGHRRRVSVRLRHGRAGRLSVRRPHRADVEPPPADRRLSRRQAVAAALLRPDPLLPGERDGSCCRLREDFPRGRYRLDIEESTFRLGEYNRFLHDNAGSIARSSARSRLRSTRSANAGRPRDRRSSRRTAPSPKPRPTPNSTCRPTAVPWRRTSPATSGRSR